MAFTEPERLIGDAAKNQVSRYPINTVFNEKQLIGRKFDDPVVQKDIKLWPFKVEGGPDGRPIIILVKYQNQIIYKFHPVEISSMVLVKIMETAEAFINKPVKRAVISVPAYLQ